MTNTELLRLNQNITAWEREEVQHYDKIYFHGPKAKGFTDQYRPVLDRS